jgi:hypothetical protein
MYFYKDQQGQDWVLNQGLYVRDDPLFAIPKPLRRPASNHGTVS